MSNEKRDHFYKVHGFHAVHTAVDFLKLLSDNKIEYKCVKNEIHLSKNGKVLQAHCLDNRADLFEIMLRNNFLKNNDPKLKEVK